ncbi:UL36 very large tegument protein [Streptomyces sp. NPDC048604]|uniref:UL36 very large tegument protein n=1 Tax=Streptomyces sp. NPDC048604 TaxID=3365578 RepID=UPI0037126049
MTVHQQTVEIGAFVRFLRDVEARSTPDAGWYGVFAARDPEGLRACLDGVEILPWDVVESLLRDLGQPPEAVGHARSLHAAAAAAYDRRPGGAEALRDRRTLMDGERRAAEARAQDLAVRLHTAPPAEAAGLSAELSWARDDGARAAARVAELSARLAVVAEPPLPPPPSLPPSLPPSPPPAEPGRRRPRGARYAWLEEGEDEGGTTAAPVLPAAQAAPPRGARFGGAPDASSATSSPPPTSAAPVDEAGAARAAGNAVYALQRLRSQGRSGEAHALLCEALAGPPGWLPALARELHRAGLAADWTTLLWEAASLPPQPYAAVVGALADSGLAEDCEQLLRQGVARPVAELAEAVAALEAAGRAKETRTLLAALVRTRSPEEAAGFALAHPAHLVPLLLAAVRAAAPAHEPALLHALRAAGLPTV